jgi:hypothetical protein
VKRVLEVLVENIQKAVTEPPDKEEGGDEEKGEGIAFALGAAEDALDDVHGWGLGVISWS